jgi:diguanylate cyclase (GGDEF)-like protein
MDGLVATPRVLEIGFDLLSAAAGLFVVAMALRVASAFTLYAHRQAMRVLAAAAVLHYLGRAERDEVSSLKRSAEVDKLTGLSTRSFFERVAARRIEQAKDNGTPIACVVLDVDDFKSYNDSHGHGAGDEILRCVARAMSESARADELVARYGGEEFVLLLNGDVEGAREVAERMRRTVQKKCVPEREGTLERLVTVSLGVAPLTEEIRTLERLIAIADAEMYRAKKTGKNKVSVFVQDG